MSVLAMLAARAKGQSRAAISRHALRAGADVPRLIAAAPAITAAELGKVVDGLRYGWEHRQDPGTAQATLANMLRAFTTSSDIRCRALAAEAFPLIVGPHHRYTKGEVSATKLIADPEVAVLVALARNHHMRVLPESQEGLAVRFWVTPRRGCAPRPVARAYTCSTATSLPRSRQLTVGPSPPSPPTLQRPGWSWPTRWMIRCPACA
jgi:hypothetical protein